MIPMPLGQIARAINAAVPISASVASRTIGRISIDSRNLMPGDLFVAIHGEVHNGHDYLAEVAARRAAAAVIDEPQRGGDLTIPALEVADTRAALGQLGRFVRDQLSTRVIAIGGSNGKTTTKHLVGSVLAARFRGTQSPKSFNNDIGVPLTLLGVSPADDYVVLELGTNHPGELLPLSHMARADIAAITSIGQEHLEGFGDLDGVRREEAALLEGLASHAMVVATADDRELLPLVRGRAPRLVTFGFCDDADLAIEEVRCSLDGIEFKLRGTPEPFALPLPGRHNASNALVAIAVGREFGIDDETIRHALRHCSRPEMRMQVVRQNGLTILNDAYNANPSSMVAALETLAQADLPGRRIAVLGEMRELGAASSLLHHEVGEAAARSRLDLLIAVGDPARPLVEGAKAGGFSAKSLFHVEDVAGACAMLRGLVREGDTILIKASRGVKLERLVDTLLPQS